MNELQTQHENRREILRQLSLGGVFGFIASLFVSEAKAQDGGGYAAAKAVADLILVVQGYVKKFNEFRDDVKQASAKNAEFIDEQKAQAERIGSVAGTVDGFYRRFRNFGMRMDRIPKELESFTRAQFKEIENLSARYEAVPKTQRNKRNQIASEASTRAGHSFGVVAAKGTRARYASLGEHIEKSELASKDRSKAEVYTASMGPVVTEQFQLILEASLRHEKQMERLIEILGGTGAQSKDRSPYGPTELRSDFENFKSGGGTLPSED